jgi:hypothetical protein
VLVEGLFSDCDLSVVEFLFVPRRFRTQPFEKFGETA